MKNTVIKRVEPYAMATPGGPALFFMDNQEISTVYQ